MGGDLVQCTGCGAEIDPRDKFCSKCGAITERGKGASELAGRYVAELADDFGKLFAAALGYVTNPENRKRVSIGGGVALALLISLTSNPISRGVGGLFSSTPDGPTYNDDGTPNFAEYEDVFLAERASYDVTGQANVRDFPTGEGTTVISTLVPGETVEAQEVMAFDPNSQWLKLATGGYVWGANLAPRMQNDSGDNAASAQLNSNEFPDFLRGRWSWSEDCEIQQSDQILIDADTIQFEHSSGRLLKIEEQGRSRIYHLAMSNDQRAWNAEFAITIADDRSSMFLDGMGETSGINYQLYNPETACRP